MPVLFIYVFGISVSFIQLLFFREIMPVFQAADIVSGFFVLHSVAGLALGFYIASKLAPFQNPGKIIFFTAVALIAVLFIEFAFIRNMRFFLSVPSGGGISLRIAFVYIFGAIAPINFVIGIISRFAYYPEKIFYRFFVSQSLGFISGCLIYFFFMTQTEGLLTVLITASVISFSLFFISSGRKTLFFAACAFIFFIYASEGILFDISAFDKKLLERSFISSSIEDYKYTPYGQNVLTQKNGEYSFFTNQILMFSKPDIEILESEDFGHIPALHHGDLKKVLIVGGAVKYLPMIFEHNVELVDCVESDEAVVSIIQKKFIHLGYIFSDGRLHIYNENPRDFIRNSREKYDLILVGMPYPSNLQLNAYFTKEFFQVAADNLSKNGFIAVKLPGRTAFSSYIMAELNKSVLDAMQSVFKYTQIIPGNRNILIASQKRMPYRLHIKKRLSQMQETTLVLSKYYLDDRMDTQKTLWLKNELKKVKREELLNSDFNPNAMMLSVLYRQSGFSPYLSVFMDEAIKYSPLILIAVIAVFFLSKSVYNATSFVCSATAFWIMFTILFSLQIYNGQIYKWIGIIAPLFVSGILSGTFIARGFALHTPLNKKMFASELLFILITALWLLTIKFEFVNLCILSVFAFFSGFAAGAEIFVLIKISELFTSENKTKIFIFAVFGACFASFFGGSFLIPAWGITKAVVLIFFFKFLIFCRWADLNKRGL
ncbi:MAG: hypothetical protein FWD54_03215 [Endomicrobia bacterium]|nr:hypothetical protein [Endomicrobiia bacterium]MCL2799273.1 hypothetical protein [Endomicrobiia bacterium]